MGVTETSTYRDLHLPSLIIGGSFATVAICLSLYSILQHLRFYTNPAVRKKRISILFFSSIYIVCIYVFDA